MKITIDFTTEVKNYTLAPEIAMHLKRGGVVNLQIQHPQHGEVFRASRVLQAPEQKENGK